MDIEKRRKIIFFFWRIAQKIEIHIQFNLYLISMYAMKFSI